MSSVMGSSSDSTTNLDNTEDTAFSLVARQLVQQIAKYKTKVEESRKTRPNSKRTSAKVKPVYQFFCCVECGEGYSNSESLDEHRKEIHGSKKFMCDICSIGFKTEEILLKHKETDHFNQELFICPTCSSTFASKSALNKHIKIHLKTETDFPEMRLSESNNNENGTDPVAKPPIKLVLSTTGANGVRIKSGPSPLVQNSVFPDALLPSSSIETQALSSPPPPVSTEAQFTTTNVEAVKSSNPEPEVPEKQNEVLSSETDVVNGVSKDSEPSQVSSSPSQVSSAMATGENKSPLKRPHERTTPVLNSSVNESNEDFSPAKKVKKSNESEAKNKFVACNICSSLFLSKEKLNEHMLFHQRESTKLAVTNAELRMMEVDDNREDSKQGILSKALASVHQKPTEHSASHNATAKSSTVQSAQLPSENKAPKAEMYKCKECKFTIKFSEENYDAMKDHMNSHRDNRPADRNPNHSNEASASSSSTPAVASKLKCRNRKKLKSNPPGKWICFQCKAVCSSAVHFCFHIFNSHVKSDFMKNCTDCDKLRETGQSFFNEFITHLKNHSDVPTNAPSEGSSSKSSEPSSKLESLLAPSTSKAVSEPPLTAGPTDSSVATTETTENDTEADIICLDSDEDDDVLDDDVIPVDPTGRKKAPNRSVSVYQCSVCKQKENCKNKMTTHMETHKDVSGANYIELMQCEYCNASFQRRCMLQIHRFKHLGIVPFKCEFCSRPFASQSALTKHHSLHIKQSMRKDTRRESTSGETSSTMSQSHQSIAATAVRRHQTPDNQNPLQTTIVRVPPNTPSTSTAHLRGNAQPSSINSAVTSRVQPPQGSYQRQQVHGHKPGHQSSSNQGQQSGVATVQVQGQASQQQRSAQASPVRPPTPGQQRLVNQMQPNPQVMNRTMQLVTPAVNQPMVQQASQPSPTVSRANIYPNQIRQNVSPVNVVSVSQGYRLPQQVILQPQMGQANAMQQQQIQMNNRVMQQTGQPVQQMQSSAILVTQPQQQQQHLVVNQQGQMIGQTMRPQFVSIQARPQHVIQAGTVQTAQQRPVQYAMQHHMNQQINPRMQVVRNAHANLQQQASQMNVNQRSHVMANTNANIQQQRQQVSMLVQNPQQQQPNQNNANRQMNVLMNAIRRPPTGPTYVNNGTVPNPMVARQVQAQHQQQQQQQQQHPHIQGRPAMHPQHGQHASVNQQQQQSGHLAQGPPQHRPHPNYNANISAQGNRLLPQQQQQQSMPNHHNANVQRPNPLLSNSSVVPLGIGIKQEIME